MSDDARTPSKGDPVEPRSRVGNAAQTYATSAGAAGLSLLNVLVVARQLGPSGRGDIAFLIAVATLTSHLAGFGIHEANANVGGTEPGLRPALATNSVVFALIFGALAGGAVMALTAVAPSVGGDVERVWLLVALAAVPMLILKVYLQFLVQAEYGFGVTNLAWIVGPLTTAGTNSVLAAIGVLSVGSAIVVWVVGQVMGLIILLRYIHRHSGFSKPDAALADRSARFGAKTHLGRFMTMGNYRVDQWFIGAMSGSRELGFYSIAVAWAELLFYIPGVLVLVQRPDLVRASAELAARLAAQFFRVALVIALVGSVVLVVAAPILCTLVFGQEFSNSIDDLRLLSLAGFGIVSLQLLGSALTAQRRPLLAAAPVAVAFLITIILDIVLIPRYGGAGAAIATSVAWTTGGVVAVMIFRRVLPTALTDFLPRPSDFSWVWRKLQRRLSS